MLSLIFRMAADSVCSCPNYPILIIENHSIKVPTYVLWRASKPAQVVVGHRGAAVVPRSSGTVGGGVFHVHSVTIHHGHSGTTHRIRASRHWKLLFYKYLFNF